MSMKKIDLAQFAWLNQPEETEVGDDTVEFVTQSQTDFWQRTHSGFRRDNGHAFLTRLWDDFSFSVQAEFFYETPSDQSGIILYLDSDNWARLAVEYEDETYGLLGSVVTERGYSDWATTPVVTDYNRMFYRLSRRGSDFRFDFSPGGEDYRRMRIFHLPGDLANARVGVYACSPNDSSFRVRFSEFAAGPSLWVD